MSKRIIIFHHSDLDGMGVKILSILLAKYKGLDYETHKCNYHDIDQIVEKSLSEASFDEVAEIIVGDISVGESGAHLLEYWDAHGVPVRLRDHHATAEWLNKFPWAKVTETIEEVQRCGTWLLHMEPEFGAIYNYPMKYFVTEVGNWDTWKWKSLNDNYASQLNALFQILGENDFTDYMLELFDNYEKDKEDNWMSGAAGLFTDYANALIDAHNRSVRKIAHNCESSMWTMKLQFPKKDKHYNTGIVFVTHDISDIADIILMNHPEIDILMLVGYPRNISFRTQKNLDIPLGDVAKLMTGSGGGHPMAAGSVISAKQFKKLFEKSLDIMSGKPKGLEYTQIQLTEKE